MSKEVAALGLTLLVHVVAVGVLLWAIFGADRAGWRGWWPGDDDGGGGPGRGPAPGTPDPPRGGDGLPLPDARPAGVRLRSGHDALRDAGRRARRPAHAPEPAPAPARTHEPV